MNNEKFTLRIVEVVALLLDFRGMADKSDKRILRDTIRAVVKELTRVKPLTNPPPKRGERFL